MSLKSNFLYGTLVLLITFVLGLLAFNVVNIFLKDEARVAQSINITLPDNSQIQKNVLRDELPNIDESTYISFRGLYSNYKYYYSILIPKGLVGYNVPPPMPQPGFIVPLSKQPKSYVFVGGEYNSLEWTSLDEAADFRLECVKEDGSDIEVLSRENLERKNLKAVRLKVKYKSSATNEVRIDDTIIAHRKYNDGEIGIIYTLELVSPASNYPKDVRVFEQFVKGFRLKHLPQ